MHMAWVVMAAAALTFCAGCSGTDERVASSGDDGECTSRYEPIGSAATWRDLKRSMLASQEWGPVTSVRTQAQGNDVGAGNQNAVRVVDLLNRDGRRVVQADVWRTDSGVWRAGVWYQCTD